MRERKGERERERDGGRRWSEQKDISLQLNMQGHAKCDVGSLLRFTESHPFYLFQKENVVRSWPFGLEKK